ncbi:MAG: hypothetical protein JJW00_06605 [Sulfurimonas sp.]|nr:hypothetical protein [Sulfurimonas sp.]
MSEYALVSKDTPLISNLNILENIALIKEVHQFLKTSKAQEEALSYLKKINLQDISKNRPTQCTSLEIFYISFIRALMTKDMNVIILTPFYLIDNLRDIETILSTIKKLYIMKNILILDTFSNEVHYKGCSCNMIR